MNSLNKVFLLFICVLFFDGCKTSNIKPNFVQLGKEEFVVIDSANRTIAGTITFIVENYKDNEYCIKYIDSIASKFAFAKKGEYLVQFYKSSKKTNLKNLLNNPKVFYRYSNDYDHIYSYYWSNGKFLSKQKIKNGKLIETNNNVVKISDIPVN